MNEVFETEATKTTQDDTKERQVSSSILKLDILEKHGNITTVYSYLIFACCALFFGFVSYRHLFAETLYIYT